jgi:prepilin-type N-terminal cleavage/methylation domain-containing protein
MVFDYRQYSRRGFTLIEMMIAVGIVAILSMVAIPYMTQTQRRAELRSTARDTLGKLQSARAESVARRARPGALGRGNSNQPQQAPQNPSTPQRRLRSASRSSLPAARAASNGNGNGPQASMNPTDSVVVETYVEILSTQSYSVVSVTDDGDAQIEQLVDFSLDPSTSAIQIRSPAPTSRIEFRNGQRDPSSPSSIELHDANTGKSVFVDVGLTGMRIR